jgi:hypothetical protein
MSTDNPSVLAQCLENDWYFSVNGYMEPYTETANWANDWIESCITLVSAGNANTFSLQHLLIEELEDLQEWLTKIKKGISVPRIFGFTDGDLWFKMIDTNNALVLRVEHGYEVAEQIFIDIYLNERQEFLSVQIERINALLVRFPCRCGMEHNLFSKQV